MLSINTNIASLITQNSMKTSTDKLSQAIERMTTGLKINHASDNAANYSISTNLTTQLSAYDTAADNVAMGMDLVSYASDIISQMQDKAARLNALSTQARNGTYGAQSLIALNSEASAIMSELMRLYSTAEYNDISLFNRTAYTIAPHLPQAGESGFIDETALISPTAGTTTDASVAKYNGFIEDAKTYTDAEVAAMTRVADVTTFTYGQKYSISSVEELQKLADYVNSGKNTTGVEFVLGADLDLSSISNWTSIGDYSNNTSACFKGTFDGNGHVIKNLTVNNESNDYQGLFGFCGQDSVIKNIAVVNASIKGSARTGTLAGYANIISNSYATGTVSGTDYVGGLVGYSSSSSSISNSYATGTVSGTNYVGGLVGSSSSSSSTSISNSYATGTVSGTDYVGGLVGYSSSSSISNSYATGTVSGQNEVGGLVGSSTSSSSISNSYATGNVTGQGNSVGGLVGISYSSISNSYATGTVSGTDYVGGLVGSSSSSISNSYATGTVSGQTQVGGLVGISSSSISNSYATGNVTGTGNEVGGLVGFKDLGSINNSYATGMVRGNSFVGGLIGIANAPDSNILDIFDNVSYATVNCIDSLSSGSLIGALVNSHRFSTTEGSLNLTNCQSIAQNGLNKIGGVYRNDMWDGYFHFTDYDMTTMLAGISDVEFHNILTNLQVGIYGNSSSQLSFDTNFSFDLNLDSGIESVETFDAIVAFENLLSEKATQLGAVQNRLDSALDSIEVNIHNLTSSRSTIRDADIAEVSSHYIQQQILQQASATLMATANQAPSIALQLI